MDARAAAHSMDSDSGEQSEGEPGTAAGSEGVTLPGGLGLEKRGGQVRKSRIFFRAVGQKAGPQLPKTFHTETGDWFGYVLPPHCT